MPCQHSRRRAFTMVELLVTIAILGLLLAILMPGVQSARETARRMKCASNLRQIGLAALYHHEAKKALPSGYTQDRINAAGQVWKAGSTSGYSFQGHSVFYFLLPFMEEKGLFDKMDARVPLNNRSAVQNVKAAAAMPIVICPSDVFPEGNPHQFSSTEWYGVTSYRGNAGSRPFFATSSTNDGLFMATGSQARKASTAPPGETVRLKNVTDGTAKTLLFAESAHVDEDFNTFTTAGWNSGSTISTWARWYPAGGDNGLGNLLCGSFAPINYTTPFRHGQPGAPTSQSQWFVYQDQRLSAIGSLHRNGANGAFADGSVRFLEDSMPQSILALICTRADGQQISELP